MIQSKLTWNGEVATKLVLEAGWDGIRRATEFFFRTLQDKVLNTPNSGQRRIRKRTTRAGAKGSSYTIYPHPSKPGNPPHKRTGFGAGNVKREYDKAKLMSRVGALLNAKYMIFHELGKGRRYRPWLFKTLEKLIPQLKAIAESGKSI